MYYPNQSPYERLNLLQQQYSQQYGSTPPMQSFSQQLIRVKGIEGAKAYHMPPNSMAALFNDSEDIMYIKETDGAGYPTIRTYRFSIVEDSLASSPNLADYLTRNEFSLAIENLKKELIDAQQPISQSAGKSGKQA